MQYKNVSLFQLWVKISWIHSPVSVVKTLDCVFLICVSSCRRSRNVLTKVNLVEYSKSRLKTCYWCGVYLLALHRTTVLFQRQCGVK